MIFDLPEETRRVQEELGRWATKRRSRLGAYGPLDETGWAELARFGLLTGTVDDQRDLEIAAGMLAAAKGGMPGPVLEAELAVASGNDEAVELVRQGRVVTSVTPHAPARAMVGWGAVADLVVNQADGATLTRGHLPEAHTPLPTGHGFIDRPPSPTNGAGADPLARRRWMLASALLTGLGQGAVEIASQHVRTREQFGRTLSSFQAVQFRLAEASVLLEAAELAVFDVAQRSDADDPSFGVTAALAWLNACRVADVVEKHVHQVLGGIGFTAELGVIALTYQMWWLRSSVGRGGARRFVRAHRSLAAGVPASTIIGGFTPAAGGAAAIA